MTETDRVERNKRMLLECYPTFRSEVTLLLAEMALDGFRPRIQCAWRSMEEQAAAYRNGESHVLYGFHNVTGLSSLPEALAVDVLDDDHPLSPTRNYLLALVRHARLHNMTTGIDWDLPPNIRVALDTVIDKGGVWTGKIGWDPCHVQTSLITTMETKIGRRPKQQNTLQA